MVRSAAKHCACAGQDARRDRWRLRAPRIDRLGSAAHSRWCGSWPDLRAHLALGRHAVARRSEIRGRFELFHFGAHHGAVGLGSSRASQGHVVWDEFRSAGRLCSRRTCARVEDTAQDHRDYCRRIFDHHGSCANAGPRRHCPFHNRVAGHRGRNGIRLMARFAAGRARLRRCRSRLLRSPFLLSDVEPARHAGDLDSRITPRCAYRATRAGVDLYWDRRKPDGRAAQDPRLSRKWPRQGRLF